MPLMTIPPILKLCETLLILFYSSSSLLAHSFILEQKKEEQSSRAVCLLHRLSSVPSVEGRRHDGPGD